MTGSRGCCRLWEFNTEKFVGALDAAKEDIHEYIRELDDNRKKHEKRIREKNKEIKELKALLEAK